MHTRGRAVAGQWPAQWPATALALRINSLQSKMAGLVFGGSVLFLVFLELSPAGGSLGDLTPRYAAQAEFGYTLEMALSLFPRLQVATAQAWL